MFAGYLSWLPAESQRIWSVRMVPASPRGGTVLGWPRRCALAHALPRECGCKRLESARFLGQLGGFLTYACIDYTCIAGDTSVTLVSEEAPFALG
jgi:hypothetical protein